MTDKIHVDPFIDPAKLQADLHINQTDLDAAMMVQAGHFAYYGQMAAKAEHQLAKLEQMVKIVEARFDKVIRDRATAAGTKITEAQVTAQIALEPKVIRVRTALSEAKMVLSLCKSAADSFRHKRDMLIQLGFNGREERKGELRIMEGNTARGEAQRQDRAERARQLLQG